MPKIVSEIQNYFLNEYDAEKRITAYRKAYDEMCLNEDIDEVMEELRDVLAKLKPSYTASKVNISRKLDFKKSPKGVFEPILTHHFNHHILELFENLPFYDNVDSLLEKDVAWLTPINKYWAYKYALPEAYLERQALLLKYIWYYEFCEALLECFDNSGLHHLAFERKPPF